MTNEYTSKVMAARPERFATLDVKHWIEPPQIGQRSGLIIRTPGQVIQKIRQYLVAGFGRTESQS